MVKAQHLVRRLMTWFATDFGHGPAKASFDPAGSAPKRVCFVKLDAIGDLVIATTFLNRAAELLADSEVTFVCREPVGALVRWLFPSWDVVELDERGKSTVTMLRERFSIRTRLRALRVFDRLVDLRPNRDPSDAAVSSWIRARTKIALENQPPAEWVWAAAWREERVFDFLLPLRSQSADGPGEIVNHRELGKWLFPGESGWFRSALPTLAVTKEQQRALRDHLALHCDFVPPERFLLICPGARAEIREYPAEKLVVAAQEFLTGNRMPVVLAGARSERDRCERIGAQLAKSFEVRNLAGQLDLTQHIALISISTLVLCMETSHAHMAAALRKPATVIIGGGHYGIFGPWGREFGMRWVTHNLPCFGCYWRCVLDRPRCVQDVPPSEVAAALRESAAAAG